MALHRTWTAWALALLLLLPSTGSAGPLFAVWLDGITTPGGGGSGILHGLTQAFGAGSFELVTSKQLEDPTFLGGFDALVISRYDSSFKLTALSQAAVDNIKSYVGSGPTQGGVAVFTNDIGDSLCDPAVSTCTNLDPFDPNLYKLFVNSATAAAATGHGYIGELQGATMAFTSNDTGGILLPLSLLPGTATQPQGISFTGRGFPYEVGPIGAGHPIDAGVKFPFTTLETTLFLSTVTGFSSENIVDQYGDLCFEVDPNTDRCVRNLLGLPAIVANAAAIDGTLPPPSIPAPPSLVLLGLGLAGLAAFNRVRRNRSLVT